MAVMSFANVVSDGHVATAVDGFHCKEAETPSVAMVVLQTVGLHLDFPSSPSRLLDYTTADRLPRPSSACFLCWMVFASGASTDHVAGAPIVLHGLRWDGLALREAGGFRRSPIMEDGLCSARMDNIKPGSVYNDMFAHEDLIPTFAAAGGDPDVVVRCKKTCQSGNKSFKVHLDGYNLMPFFKGEVKESPRKEFLYWSDDGDLLALRLNQWEISFKKQEHTGLDVWQREFTNLRAPRIYNLRSDPFELGTTSFEYGKWMAERMFLIVSSQAVVGQWLASFKEFPIRQKPASFNLDEIMQKLSPKQ